MMHCCINCFVDGYLQDIILKLGTTGDCDYCKAKDVPVYDISGTDEISEKIRRLIQIYEPSTRDNARFLWESLKDEWQIFNGEQNQIQALLADLCSQEMEKADKLFVQKVEIPEMCDTDYLSEYGVVSGTTWNVFSEQLKYNNRFHNNLFNADAFASFLSIAVDYCKPKSLFFRARICPNKKGFTKEEMGAPPKGLRRAGRINPDEIPVLYLSNDEETIIYEVRANVYDYVSVGTFQNKRELKLINLSCLSKLSPFQYEGDDLKQFAINRTVFSDIATDIAKPMRRSDTPLEYLPTQFISEFVKSQHYDGVKYRSTIGSGYNIALFNEEDVECIHVKNIEIKDVKYFTT